MHGRNERKRDSDRRTAPRLPASAIPSLKGVKLVAGPEVRLINISRGGALIESNTRLSPGSALCLRLVTADSIYLLKGRVLRSRVAFLTGNALQYESALVFDEEFSMLPAKEQQAAAEAGEGAAAHPAETAPAEEELRESEPEEAGPAGEPPEVFTVTVSCTEDEGRLREMLGRNSW